MRDRALVRNAGDEEQVRRADRLAADAEAQRLVCYRQVLSTPAGRFVLRDLIVATGVFQPVWTTSAEIHKKAATHDFGLQVMKTLQDVDLELYQLMEREWWQRQTRQARTTAATHAATGGQTDGGDSSSREG